MRRGHVLGGVGARHKCWQLLGKWICLWIGRLGLKFREEMSPTVLPHLRQGAVSVSRMWLILDLDKQAHDALRALLQLLPEEDFAR